MDRTLGRIDPLFRSEVTITKLWHNQFVAVSSYGATAYVFGGLALCSGPAYSSNALFSVDMNSGLAHPLGGPFLPFGILPVSGQLGVFSPSNNPGGRYSATLWATNSSLWLYGGFSTVQNAYFADLWEFSLSSLEWTQITPNGSSANFPASLGVYGTQYSPGPLGAAGASANATHLFLIGGFSSTSVWAFDMLNSVWGWIAGSSPTSPAANANNPPFILGMCFAPSGTNNGDTWFFGGNVTSGDYGNALWFFDASAVNFTLIGGSYSNLGNLYNGSNAWPGSRVDCALAATIDGLVLTGGSGFWMDASTSYATLNDVWVFGFLGFRWAFVNGNVSTFTISVYDSSGALILPLSLTNSGTAGYGHKAFFFAGNLINSVLSFALFRWPDYCLAGTYGDSFDCANCSEGTYSAQDGSLSCTPCPVGTYAPSGGFSACLGCPAGTYSTQEGVSICAGSCDVGQYSDVGQTRCYDCPTGTYFIGTNVSCPECGPGTYTNKPGLFACVPCQAGRYAYSSASTGCNDCPIGTYTGSTAQSMCSSCADNGTTFVTASVLPSQCVCPVGSYGRLSANESCKLCPANAQGVSCPLNSSLPHIAAGFARASPFVDPSLAFQCIPSVACVSTGDDSSFTTCAVGYTDTNCSSCSAGYYRNEIICDPCPSALGMALFFIGVLLFLAILAAVLYFWKGAKVSTEVKIAAYGLQFLGTFNFISSSWPFALSGMFNFLSLSNLDLNVAAPECAVAITFFGKTVVRLLMPGVAWIVGTLFVSAVGAIKSGQRFVMVARDRVGPLGVMTLLGFYTVIVKALSEPLQCTQQPDGRYAMTASPDIACYESQWNAFLPWLVIFWLLYVVAAPTGLFMLFRRLRGNAQLQAKYNQLVSDYRAQFDWWGLVVVLRKMALVSSSTILSGALKYFVTFTLILAFLFLEISVVPYKTHTTLQVSLLWSIIPAVLLRALGIVFESASVSTEAQGVLIFLVVGSTVVATLTKRKLLTCGNERVYLEMKGSEVKDVGTEAEGVFRIKRPASTVVGVSIVVDVKKVKGAPLVSSKVTELQAIPM